MMMNNFAWAAKKCFTKIVLKACMNADTTVKSTYTVNYPESLKQ